jgi:hypothetical protein
VKIFAATIMVVTSVMGMNGVAFAHHSLAMFDLKTQIDVKGTVTEFDYVNPHTYIYMTADSDHRNWIIELQGGPGLLTKPTWHRNVLKFGDKITVHINPLRSGAAGGSLMYLIKADGTKLSIHGATNKYSRPADQPHPVDQPRPADQQ